MNGRQNSPGGRTHDHKRRQRHEAQHFLWKESKLPRVQGCGRSVRSRDGVAVKVTDQGDGQRRAGFAGVAHCGSTWACPECGTKIAATRQLEIQDALLKWTRAGGRVALATFTVRHHRHHRLRRVWEALSAAWKAATSGSAWKAEQRVHGSPTARLVAHGPQKGRLVLARRVHTIRVVEVTHGANGWHVHVHVLLLLRPETTHEDVDQLTAQMFGRWRQKLLDVGMPAPTWKNGVDGRLLVGDPSGALGEYFVKAAYSASHEIAAVPQNKLGRGGNITPMQLLARIVRDGDADDLDLWHEWERDSRGRRQIAWSAGLRQLVGADDERTDEEIAEDDQAGAVIAQVPTDTWKTIVAARARAEVLEAFEQSTAHGLEALDRYGGS